MYAAEEGMIQEEELERAWGEYVGHLLFFWFIVNSSPAITEWENNYFMQKERFCSALGLSPPKACLPKDIYFLKSK